MADAKAESKVEFLTSAPTDFVKVQMDRNVYKPESCGDVAVKGILVDCLDMPPTANGAWKAFLIRLTAPTKVVNRDDKVVSAAIGEEIILPATGYIRSLESIARHPDAMAEVYIKPGKKVQTDKGAMWTYDVNRSKTTHPRTGEFFLTSRDEAKALPASSGAQAEIPF